MLESLLAVLDLSPTARECIDRLMDLVLEENKKENEHRGSCELYEAYCSQLEKAFVSEEQVSLWESYQKFRAQEAAFFDPPKAYVAGREAKLDGETEKSIAYRFYLKKIKNDESYRNFKAMQNDIFSELLDSLRLDSLRDKLYKVDQLYKGLYAPFEKYLWIFFNLGYDCCPA